MAYFANDLILNGQHQDTKTNYFEFIETDKKTGKQTFYYTWFLPEFKTGKKTSKGAGG